MPQYLTVDWSQISTNAEDCQRAMAGTMIESIQALGAGLSYLSEFVGTWDNAKFIGVQFALHFHPVIAAFAAADRLHEVDFFRTFFNDATVSKCLPYGSDERQSALHSDFGFELESSWVAIGRLGHRLSNGGVYNARPCDAQVSALIAGCSETAFERRFSETVAYTSYLPWSNWFDGSLHDSSFFWLDKRRGIATVLLLTDSN